MSEMHTVKTEIEFQVWGEGATDAHARAQSALADRMRGLHGFHVNSMDVTGAGSAVSSPASASSGVRTSQILGSSSMTLSVPP